jgi:hypothetical protein
MNKVKAAANSDLEKLGTPEGEATPTDTSSGSSTTGSDAGGGDEFSMDLDLPGPEGGEGGEGGTDEASAEAQPAAVEGGETGTGNESIHVEPISPEVKTEVPEVKPASPDNGVLFCN